MMPNNKTSRKLHFGNSAVFLLHNIGSNKTVLLVRYLFKLFKFITVKLFDREASHIFALQ